MPRNILPWVLLVAAVFVALSVARKPSASGPGASDPGVSTGASSSPAPGLKVDDPPLDPGEQRDARVHVGHEQCEEAAKNLNVLEGNAPTDPKGLHFIGGCLRHGNLAWYKCIVGATTRAQAAACNRRLLNSENAP